MRSGRLEPAGRALRGRDRLYDGWMCLSLVGQTQGGSCASCIMVVGAEEG